jgi:pimeloyl-ACP methyl ester carboxylesterase
MYLFWLLLLLILVPTVVLVGRLYFRQDALIFRPGPVLLRSPTDLGLAFESVHLHADEEVAVQGWWIPGTKGDKAVIFFYGSDGNMTHELPTLRYLHGLGVHVLVVDYPGYGQSGGTPSEQGCYQMAEAAWSFVCDTKGFEADDVVIFGQSLGSAVGIYLAASRRCMGLVVLSGFTSVPDLAALAYPYLPARYFCRTKMNSLKRIARCNDPVLVLHSLDDEHIPIAQARQLFAQALGPKKFVGFRGLHSGSHWQRAPGVRAAWGELLSEQTERWERTASVPCRAC